MTPAITGDFSYVVCDGSTIEFTAVDQGLGTEEYTWEFGTGATPSTATGVGPHTVQFDWSEELDTSDVEVILTVSKTGCGDLQRIVSNIEVNPYPDATIDSDLQSSCWYEVMTFQPEAAELPGATYTWTFGPGAMPVNGYRLRTTRCALHDREVPSRSSLSSIRITRLRAVRTVRR